MLCFFKLSKKKIITDTFKNRRTSAFGLVSGTLQLVYRQNVAPFPLPSKKKKISPHLPLLKSRCANLSPLGRTLNLFIKYCKKIFQVAPKQNVKFSSKFNCTYHFTVWYFHATHLQSIRMLKMASPPFPAQLVILKLNF